MENKNTIDVERGYLVEKTYKADVDTINDMFNTGRFNDIVKGAIIVTMQNMNCFNLNDIRDVIYELEDGTFKQYSADNLREAKLPE